LKFKGKSLIQPGTRDKGRGTRNSQLFVEGIEVVEVVEGVEGVEK